VQAEVGRIFGLEHQQRLFPIVRTIDGVAFVLEEGSKELSEGPLIVHNEDTPSSSITHAAPLATVARGAGAMQGPCLPVPDE
jgi:hypothetical protein